MVRQLTFSLLLSMAVIARADNYILATGEDGTEIVYTADRMVYTNWLDGCVLWMPFPSDVGGGSYPDYSKEQNDGTNAVVANRPTWDSGSYDFDGVSEYIDCGNDASLQIKTDSITVVFWVKKSDTTPDVPVSKYDGSSVGWYVLLDRTSANNLYWRPKAADIGSGVIWLNNWHHVAIAQFGTTALAYVDGSYVDQWTECYENTSVVGSLIIGCNLGGDSPFNGIVDDVRVFDIALTSNQVNQIYLDTKGAH